MVSRRWSISVVSALVGCVPTMVLAGQKSAYLISQHASPSQAQAYKIDANQAILQDDVDISTYNEGYGAVGNAIWSDRELMFVTYENSPMIVWASTKTLKKEGELDTGILNLAGIAVDEEKGKIYVVARGMATLYVYSWDTVNEMLILEDSSDLELPPPYTQTAWGLVLDEDNDLLYVTNNTEYIDVYDTSTWAYEHSMAIFVDGAPRAARWR